MLYELNDILFFVKSLKGPPNQEFSIQQYFIFSSSFTRSSVHNKLVQNQTPLNTHTFTVSLVCGMLSLQSTLVAATSKTVSTIIFWGSFC